MSSPTTWSSGRYDAIGDQIAPIAAQVVSAVGRRLPLRGAALVDLACGTGSVALAAGAAGARVTAVDVTPELVALGAQKAKAAGVAVEWVTADACDTGLPGGTFDVAASNMGIIFVEPTRQVAEIVRLLRPGGVLGFSAWVPDPNTPFHRPVVAVLGPPPASEYGPDQWGSEEIITDRLAPDFDDIAIETGRHTWRLGSVDEAMRMLAHESPIHVSLLGSLDEATREKLLAAFEDAMRASVDADGVVTFDSPYVVVTAQRL
ncbi:class I SAM-dependent methyltransferase [Mycolicibacterium moriokaense]|nr:class I SAM-dependent methyltransferase [Mycolicibacterium moriokaense]